MLPLNLAQQLEAARRCAADLKAEQRVRALRRIKSAGINKVRAEVLFAATPAPGGTALRVKDIYNRNRSQFGCSIDCIYRVMRDLVANGRVEKFGNTAQSTYRRK
jgi:hypothetical protein